MLGIIYWLAKLFELLYEIAIWESQNYFLALIYLFGIKQQYFGNSSLIYIYIYYCHNFIQYNCSYYHEYCWAYIQQVILTKTSVLKSTQKVCYHVDSYFLTKIK